MRARALALFALLALWPALAVGQTYILPPPVSVVSVVSAVNASVTATIPASGAGLFHYITGVEITHSCATGVAGSAILTITTTNLPGSLSWQNGNVCGGGNDHIEWFPFQPNPLKASAANTATTITCPAFGATAICAINVYFFPGP